MINFIQRRYQNINTNEVVDFDRLTKIHIQMPLGGTGFEKEHQSTITIILGEPASGKTYQLKQYHKHHKDTSIFVELINLDNTLTISPNIDIVLIDSIDEALPDLSNPKKLQKKLVDFIERCKAVNNRVRFVITSRFLEWSNIFESSLKEIDKELRIYSILELSRDDINNLLVQKGINLSDFWKFIEENYLVSLLKNILVVLSLIDRFDEYKTKQVTFVDIYHDIAKEYLSKKGDDREEIVSNISINKLLKIASSLATYMTFNRKSSINSSNLSTIAGELYQADGSDIIVDDLKIILNTALFEKKGNEFSFFHQSIQEYLTAYFLANKDFEIELLKSLLSSKMRFYEEFEEVVVFLTNIKTDLFYDFVEFDPFIFKRHPALSKEQQEILLKTILNKFQNHEVQAWGRWESFVGSTLVKFDKLDNLVDILKEHCTGSNANDYLMNLLKNNYTKGLQDFIFDIFRQKLIDKNSLSELIRRNFIDNYDFNVELYDFMKENGLLIKDEYMLFMSFEAELFCSLYGIKYKHQYGSERVLDRTNFQFNELMYLFQYIPTKMLEYIAPYLTKEDAKKWFEHLQKTYNRQEDNYEYVLWVLYAVLNHYSSKTDLEEVVTFVKENHVFLHSWDKKKNKLNFKKISKDFWELYFESTLFDDIYSHNNIIFTLYDIELKDIIEVVKQYPIKDNLEKYVQFRLIENVDGFLMKNDDFKKHMESIWKQQEKQQRQVDEEFRKKYPEVANRNEEDKILLKECIQRFDTEKEKENDLYYLFFRASRKQSNSITKLEKYLQEILSYKYSILIDRIKSKFKLDKLYSKIKNELSSSTIYYDTLLFQYLFSVSVNDEIDELINTKKDYIKLFWHAYKFSLDTMDEYFIELSSKYFECFKLLTLHALKLSLKESEKKKIGNFHLLIDIYKQIDKFDENNLYNINRFLKENRNIFTTLEESRDRETLLEVAILDRENFDYILDFLKSDKSNMVTYLEYLLRQDPQKTIKNFLEIYEDEKTYQPWWIRLKNKLTNKKIVENGYDKFEINPEKIKLYQNLLFAIKNSKIDLDSLETNHVKVLLEDYYKYFLPYQRPNGVHSVGIYEKMYDFISKVWEYLQNTTKHIDLLEELSKHKNHTVVNQAKYALTKAYELQERERSYPNSYYKRIFDKENKKDDRTIVNNGIYVEGNNSGVITQNKSDDTANEGEKWYQKWWFFSIIAGGIAFCGILWSFDSWIFATIGGIASFLIVWKLNPKFRFRNIGYALLGSGVLSNLISFSGTITIPKNNLIHGVIKIGGNDFPIFLLLISIPFFILDHLENRR